MKLFLGLLTFALALIISAVAAYFSVVGLAALFAAAFWPVVLMGTVLETGKLVAVTWLHANWHNPRVNWFHKTYLTVAVVVLMMITALGIYGYLAKGHLEQEAPLASVQVQIGQIEQRIGQTREARQRLDDRLKQLDASVNTIIGNSKTARETQQALRARDQQKKERDQIAAELLAKDAELNKLTDSLVPLKMASSDVEAKLGPVKYVAKLFGWNDPTSAVQLIILMIMFAFDPLAITLVLSAAITIGEWMDERRKRKEQRAREHDEFVARHPDPILTRGVVAKNDRTKNLDVPPLPQDAVDPVTDFLMAQDLPPAPATPVETVMPQPAVEPMVEPTDKSPKERLIELLEQNPEFIEEMIEIAKEQSAASEGEAKAEVMDGVNDTKVSNMGTSTDENAPKTAFWLDRTPHRDNK